ncbi:START domain-containing protein [Thermodesulfobacteriota bacterium]
MEHTINMKTNRMLIFIISIFLTMPSVSAAAEDLPAHYCLVQNKWKPIYSESGITVYSQRAPDSDVLALKAAGILKAPIDQVMEVLRKVEISKEWIPNIDTKFSIKELSDLEAVTYSVNVMPWPFADRSLLLHNKLRLDSVRKSLVVEVYSIGPETFHIKENHVRAVMYCGHMFIRPVGMEQTEMEFILVLDPRGHIPAWLVNMAQKSLPYEFLTALEKKAGQTSYELRPSFKEMLDQLIALRGN